MATNGEGGSEVRVLVVEADPAATASLVRDLDGAAGLSASGEPVAADVTARLAEEAFDSLVVAPAALDEDGPALLSQAAAVAPDCPVILLTDRDPDSLADDLLARASTIVEVGPDDDRSFLAEKIRGAVATTAADDPREMYRTLVETARDGLYRVDANGEVVYLNESFADMLGYDRAELVGEHASGVMAAGELERGQQVVQHLLDAEDQESDIVEMKMETKEGETITVSVHFVVLTEDGTYDGLMGVVRDVTERREHERELERQNERLNEFATIVSHDLRNPLNIAQGHLEFIRRECDSDHVDDVDRALSRMQSIIEGTLTLARSGRAVGDRERVDLAAVVDSAWDTVRTNDADLVTDDLPAVSADRGRLRTLFENLFRNSVEHGSTGSQNARRSGDAAEDGSTSDDAAGGRGGATVRVGGLPDGFYVEDDGPGIPADEREEVLTAGVSRDGGTGLGLAIVREVVTAHGWSLAVTESGSGGARFEVMDVDLVG